MKKLLLIVFLCISSTSAFANEECMYFTYGNLTQSQATLIYKIMKKKGYNDVDSNGAKLVLEISKSFGKYPNELRTYVAQVSAKLKTYKSGYSSMEEDVSHSPVIAEGSSGSHGAIVFKRWRSRIKESLNQIPNCPLNP